MTSLRIGVDVDGVLANFNVGYKALIERHTPLRLPDISDYYPTTWHYEKAAGISPADEARIWGEIRESSTFWLGLSPYPDTLSVLDRLSVLGLSHDIYFITSRVGRECKSQTERWLRYNGWASVASPTVLISSEKGLCCKALKLTHYLDDRNENVADVLAESPETQTFMLAQPWNQQQGSAPRIPSVAEFLEEVERASRS